MNICILFILFNGMSYVTPACYTNGPMLEPHDVVYLQHLPYQRRHNNNRHRRHVRRHNNRHRHNARNNRVIPNSRSRHSLRRQPRLKRRTVRRTYNNRGNLRRRVTTRRYRSNRR